MHSLGPPTSAAPLRRLVAELGCREASDAEVLSRFIASRDEASFGTLVRRHGPMVLHVCRCVLRSDADAEDAFQAVFLTLATKAESARAGDSLASWLHGVAYRIAQKARVASARRRARESRAGCSASATTPDLSQTEAREAVHESLLALPDRYRTPLTLCYLEGRTQDEAARSLGLTRAGLKKRLEAGRDRLRDRLVSRGMGAAALPAAWPGATSVLPDALARSTTLAATLIEAGKGAVAPAVSAWVLALVEGGSRVAIPIGLKIAAAIAIVVGTACFALHRPGTPGVARNASRTNVGEPATGQPEEKRIPMDAHGDALPKHAVARLGAGRFRSDTWVTQVVVVPGGNQLLGHGFSDVILWDAATGKEIRRFACPATRRGENGIIHSVQIGSFAVSPDGKTLAVGTADGTGLDCPILLFDLASGRKRGEWPGHRGDQVSANNALAFVSPSLLVSAGADGSVRVWDVPAKREARRLATPEKSSIGRIVPSPDGKCVFGAGSNGKSGQWMAWEVATGKVVGRVADLPGTSVKLAVSPDGTTLAVAIGVGQTAKEADHTEVRVYLGPNWKERKRWNAHEGKFPWRCSVAFAPDGKTIATGGADQMVRRWDVNTGKEIGTAIRLYKYANKVAYLEKDTLLTFDSQNTIKCWNPATGKPKLEFAGSESHLTALAYSPDGRHVAAGGGGGDATIRVWEVASGKLVAHLKAQLSDITTLRFSPDGKQIASGDSGGAARLWDWAKGDCVRTLSGHKPWLHTVAFSPDGKHLATGDEAGVVRVWDRASSKKLHTLEGHTAQIAALAYSPDGRTLFSAGWDHSIRQWDQTTGKVVRVIKGTRTPAGLPLSPGHTNVVTSLAVSPGGRWLYSGSYDHTICVWETATGRLCRVLKGTDRDYNSSVNAIALSPDGTRLAAAIGDERHKSSVHLWDITSGEKLAALPGHRGMVTQVAFSPDGRRLASASTDTTVLIWDATVPARRARGMDAESMTKLWDDLASDDPAISYAAVCRLASADAKTISGLKEKLSPAVAVDTKKVAEWVGRLDSDVFAERQQASRSLADLGPGAESALLVALEKAKSAEVKKTPETTPGCVRSGSPACGPRDRGAGDDRQSGGETTPRSPRPWGERCLRHQRSGVGDRASTKAVSKRDESPVAALGTGAITRKRHHSGR